MLAGDKVGVLLNMDEGTITFGRDGAFFDSHTVVIHDTAYKYLRSGAAGGPPARMLYPIVGCKKSGTAVNIRHCKWISRPGEPATTTLTAMLEAATLLQRWDRPASAVPRPLGAAAGAPAETPVKLPLSVLQEAYGRFAAMYAVEGGRGVREFATRAGVRAPFERSGEACQRALNASGYSGEPLTLRGGDRVRTDRGEGTIVGAYR